MMLRAMLHQIAQAKASQPGCGLTFLRRTQQLHSLLANESHWLARKCHDIQKVFFSLPCLPMSLRQMRQCRAWLSNRSSYRSHSSGMEGRLMVVTSLIVKLNTYRQGLALQW
jgi:hypothetical protein